MWPIVLLTWNSRAGLNYCIRSSPSLAAWQTAAEHLPSQGANTTWTGTATVPGKRFYRVVEE